MRTGRAIVTGIAASTCVGEGVEPFLDALAGRLPPGVTLNGAARTFPPLPDGVAMHPRIRSTHPLTMRLVWTVERELGAYLGGLSEQERERTGVSFGHAYGHVGSYFDYFDAATLQGYRVVHPLRFLSTLTNYAAAEVNNAYSLWGSSIPIGTSWNAGIEAIGAAVDAVAAGDDETMVAGGFEETSEATRRVLAAAVGSLPPLTDSGGFGVAAPAGEGIGVLLLQSREAAERSRRPPLAEIGPVVSLHGISWTDAGSVSRARGAMAQALDRAGVPPDEVDVVFASALGFRGAEDLLSELVAAFPGRPRGGRHVDVSGVAGQCFAGTGALQCVAAVAAVAPTGLSDRLRGAIGGPDDRARSAVVLSAGAEGSFATVAVHAPDASAS